MTRQVIDRFAREHAFLSNFYPLLHGVADHAGIRYPAVEHAFQAQKTLDLDARQRIANLTYAGDAKRAGQKLALRPGWDQIRVFVMGELLAAKFEDPSLADRLLATGDAVLVEGNGHGDRYWGVCGGQGRNVLGHLLMTIRHNLQETT